MTTPSQKLQIDIVSDVMCPWCVIGYRQLAAALEATNTPYDMRWHPFELNPNMPPEGQNLSEHLTEKYSSTKAESDANRERLTQMGAELDFTFQFSDTTRMHNTFNVHQLMHWADLQGRKHDLKMAFFAAHFTDGRNLSDETILADIAEEIGLDRAEAVAILADQRFANEVCSAEQHWVNQGIRGVPAIIFNQQHLVTGAQGVENYSRILEQLSEMKN